MKTLYILVLLCALCVSAFAQTTTITLPRKTEFYSWDNQASPPAWEVAGVYTTTYNNRAQQTEQVLTFEDENQSRAVNTYDNFRLTETLLQTWNPETNQWMSNLKSTYTYDAQGRMLTITSQSNFGAGTGTLVNTGKTTYTYTGNETNPTIVVSQNWDATSNSWVNDERSHNFMWATGGGNPAGFIMYETQEWVNNAWVNEERVNSSYDTNTRKLTITTEEASGSNWENESREITTYDERMNVINSLSQEWDGNSWEFDSETQYVLTYNTSNVLTERITRQRTTEDEELENSIREVYSDFQTFTITKSAEQLPQSSLAVFPNPTTDDLKITLKSVEFKEAQVELINTQGVKVYEAAIPHRSLTSGLHVIPTEHLASGLYILHIRTDNNKEIARRVLKN
ncbi:T9SS type A sorting domain-containing protein [Sabulibacter ruber]|uniref:T9SS type A sorting domain-containing protein n=1 Tax=Sabulibacter ruber TaxID=2811901 RepID=UPI001A96B247|nr:T9SS type A sorting domain-containing protein [Sabulibacter ruber]